MIRAMIYNFVFQLFRGKRGIIMMVALLALYFVLQHYGVINF